MNQKQIIHKTPDFEVLEIDENYYIDVESYSDTCVILPYEFNDQGILNNFYTFKYRNPFTNSDVYSSKVLETTESKDNLSECKSFLSKYFDIKENERWTYLGVMNTDRICNRVHTIYAVNVSNLKKLNEDDEMVKIESKEIIFSPDSLLIVPFLKLYRKIYQKSLRVE